jgi:hypothetical protein
LSHFGVRNSAVDSHGSLDTTIENTRARPGALAPNGGAGGRRWCCGLWIVCNRGFKIGQSPSKPASPPSDAEVYTGSILYVPDEGKICRQVLFDNRTGRMQDNGLVDCEHAYYQGTSEIAMQWSNARARVISESFRQH